MSDEILKINSPRQLKDWIKNVSQKNNLVANVVLQNYMMERLLERISKSKYHDNFILKGGFLIAAMIGIDMRSTMDMDTTIKGIPVNEKEIEKIITEIISVPVDDNVTFELQSIKSIHEEGQYEDFRINLVAKFFTMQTKMKIDITTGDKIIPKEINYNFKLMFEDREISVKAYNLETVLAEKVESVLARNVTNTRMRDYYDIYILLKTRSDDIDKNKLIDAIIKKANERGTTTYIENSSKYITDIENSEYLKNLWTKYQDTYSYSNDIDFLDITKCISNLFSE
jgi:predicted nucleotidyltransferase component of viral defense system